VASEPSSDAIALVDLFEVFGPLYRRHVGRGLPQGVSAARLRLLALLADQETLTMAEASKALGGSAQNLTGLVDALEAEQMVMRHPHPSDRRKTLITLTDSAGSTISAEREAHRRKVAVLFDTLSTDEKQHMLSILAKLNQAMATHAE
jgi:DNA-binding MarR family transcriptional regulator